jgi:CubicO group peptidase (beta-lactamase class C family)
MDMRAALTGLGLMLAASAGAQEMRPPVKYLDSVEAEYLARHKKVMADPLAERGYEPREVVPGATDRPLPVAKAPRVSARALAAARDVAARANSSAFIVVHQGEVLAEAHFGGSAEDLLVSKSLAKPITALAVGRALALGKLTSIDQKLGGIIKEWEGKPQGEIRVRHLLDMRSGLLSQGDISNPQGIWSRSYLHPYHERIILEEYPLTDAPGSIYEYSNATSELVALVIERLTGRRYAEFVGTELLARIGAPGGQVWVNREAGLAHSGCCMMLPAQSYLRMAMLVAQDGVWNGERLLPQGYVAEMKTPTAENPHYGMGLWVGGRYTERRSFANPARGIRGVLHSEPFLSDDVVMFDGNSNQIVYIVPSQQLVVLRMGPTPPREAEWDNAKLINTVLRGLKGARLTPQPR